MQFKDIYGHQKEKLQLTKAVNENKLSHALLFYGADGNSALSIARALAQYLNCENRVDNDSCGSCSSCNKFSKLIHPDLHYSYPVYTKKTGSAALSVDFINEWRSLLLEQPEINVTDWFKHIGGENKNANISAAECSDIIRKLQLKNYEANYKIMIIWQADLLKKEGNKLLKIIEEPPNNTIFILITKDLDNMLDTILSRTRQIKIPLLTDETLQQLLIEKHQLDNERAGQIVALAEGDLNKALALINEVENNFSQLTIEWYQAAFKNDVAAANMLVDKIAGLGKQNQKHFINYNLNFLRQTLITQNTEKIIDRYNAREQKLLKYLSENLNLDQISNLIKHFNEQYYYIDRNVNARIQYFYVFVEFTKYINTKVGV